MEEEEAMVIHILLWLLWFCGCPNALASAESAGRHWRAEMTTTVRASECTSAWKSSSALPWLSGRWSLPLMTTYPPRPCPCSTLLVSFDAKGHFCLWWLQCSPVPRLSPSGTSPCTSFQDSLNLYLTPFLYNQLDVIINMIQFSSSIVSWIEFYFFFTWLS